MSTVAHIRYRKKSKILDESDLSLIMPCLLTTDWYPRYA